MPGCPDIFEIGVTKIIGVYFYDDPGQEKPAWICARHKYDDSEKIAKQNMELDESERTKSDDEFEVGNESYVVTRYARPRGLASIRDDRIDLK